MANDAFRIDLTTFFLSISSTAMMHLGVVPPNSNEPPIVDLQVSQQNIALLELLKEKTNGNRTPEEDRLLDELLFQLRMRYIEVSKK